MNEQANEAGLTLEERAEIMVAVAQWWSDRPGAGDEGIFAAVERILAVRDAALVPMPGVRLTEEE